MEFKTLRYALGIVLVGYWLPYFFTWFVLEAPWWVAAILAFVALYLIIDIERRRTGAGR